MQIIVLFLTDIIIPYTRMSELFDGPDGYLDPDTFADFIKKFVDFFACDYHHIWMNFVDYQLNNSYFAACRFKKELMYLIFSPFTEIIQRLRKAGADICNQFNFGRDRWNFIVTPEYKKISNECFEGTLQLMPSFAQCEEE
eukprot:283326_1